MLAAVLLVLAVLMTQPAVGQLATHLASSFEGALGGFNLTNNANNAGVQRTTVAFSAAAAHSGTLGLVVNISSVSNTSYAQTVLLSVRMCRCRCLPCGLIAFLNHAQPVHCE